MIMSAKGFPSYIVDLSKDGVEWEEYPVGGSLENITKVCESLMEQGWQAIIWNDLEIKIWENGEAVNNYSYPSQQEEEFKRCFGNAVPRYETALPSLNQNWGTL